MKPFVVTIDGFINDFDPALLTVFSFSGGTQSTMIAHQLIRDEMPRPKNLVVLNADPGMENSLTYTHIKNIMAAFEKVDIEAYIVPGPNLLEDLLAVENGSISHLNNPPYFTLDTHGNKGQLSQGCTQYYKIAPMDRFVRKLLLDKYHINNPSPGSVEKWIGFDLSDAHRIKPPKQKYVRFRYPLIEQEINVAELNQYYLKRNLQKPPKSLCNACYAYNAEMIIEMRKHRPHDYAQAKAVDKSIRNMSMLGVRDTVYMSRELIPLDDITESHINMDFINDGCDSGYCFT